MYGKIWYGEDVQDLRSVETEFLAIIFNDSLTSNETLSCEPTVSSLNDNEMFDESDDEDYTMVFDKNSFSYKIIFANDLKTDLENDNEKVNMPLFPSPELSIKTMMIMNIDMILSTRGYENTQYGNSSLVNQRHLWLCYQILRGLTLDMRKDLARDYGLYILGDDGQDRHAEGRKSGARLSGGHFIGHFAHHFSLVSNDGLRGLSIVTRELPLIDMGELVKYNICREIGDD
ncbi:hypothetical protein Tco_0757028 [Tanacetum coccineum]